MANTMVGMSLDYLVKNLYDLIYPVGICIDFDTESVDPNTAFPGTTWVRINDGRYVVAGGPGTVIGGSGGSKSFTIGVDNLPSHSHSMTHTHSIEHNHGPFDSAGAGSHSHSVSGTTGGGGNHSHTRGTMNITGAFTALRRASRQADGDISGAFVIRRKWNASNSWSGDDDDGTTYDFDASKTWTGNTTDSGTHTHTFSANTSTAANHTHSVDIPNYVGSSGGSSSSNTGSSGSGTAISFNPEFHRYARWKRTA